MTTIYFISNKEQESSVEVKQTIIGEVKSFFSDKHIQVAYSSPEREAIERIKPFTDSIRQPIYLVEEFSERKLGNIEIDRFAYEIEQWERPEYKAPSGESLLEVQERMIDGLQMLVNKEAGKTVIVSTHSVALATVINFFDESFGYRDCVRMNQMKPYMVKFDFDGEVCIGIEEIIGMGKN